MGDTTAYTMPEFISTHTGASAVELSEDPLFSGKDHDFGGFITVEHVLNKNGKVIIPAIPTSNPYELYGARSIHQETFLKALRSRASNQGKSTIARILGVLPTIAFPILKSKPVFIETPWLIAEINFKGQGSVSDHESLIQQLTINPVDHSFEIESNDIKSHINSSFEGDLKKLTDINPKFSIKNKFMNGMEVSASLKFELETSQLMKFTATADLSEPSFKVYKELYASLQFGFEAVMYIRKNGRNNKNHPFEGIEVPNMIPLGEQFYANNLEGQISQQWKDLINFPDFRVKTETPFLKNINYLNSDAGNNNTTPFLNKTSYLNSAGKAIKATHNTIWHNNSRGITQTTNYKYIRVMVANYSDLTNFVISPFKPFWSSYGETIWESYRGFMINKTLPFLESSAENTEIFVEDNPEIFI